MNRVLSREAHGPTAAWDGSLAYGVLPITVAGPRPDFTALPHFPSLQIVSSVYGGRAGVSTNARTLRQVAEGSAVFPVGFALFEQGAQAFLGILEAVEFVEENIH